MPSSSVTRSDLPMIAIIGRANVGKSTLWNRITERQRAIVSDTPHTTRDRNIAEAVWRGVPFEITDTGGMDVEDTTIGEGIHQQALIAIKNADLVFFMIDARTGVLPEDRELVKKIRAAKKPVILIANKVDSHRDLSALAESGVYGLGFSDPVSISAATGRGIGDLLDAAFDKLHIETIGGEDGKSVNERRGARSEERELHRKNRKAKRKGKYLNTDNSTLDLAPRSSLLAPDVRPIRLVIMGRTNVGKSSIVNAILGEERVIVADLPHTTREPQDTPLTYKGTPMVLIDTAGMRRRAKLKKGVETEALDLNKKALEDSDIAALVLDATEEPTSKDKELAGLMKDEKKGLVIVINKWDLIPNKTPSTVTKYEANIRSIFPFLDWAPIIFISAKQGQRVNGILDAALKIEAERGRVIEYNAINKLMKTVIKQKKPLQVLGPKSPHIHDIAQTSTHPPKFLVTVRGEKELIHPSWLKFLERRIRDKFGFEGTPIVVSATNVPISKSERAWNMKGPGMDTVA
jgi:GTPase